MNSRERVKISLNHDEPDRIPIHDSFWESTLIKWYKEGLPEDIKINDYFNFDMAFIYCDTTPQFPMEVVEDLGISVIGKNRFGELIRETKNHAATIKVLKSPVKNYSDWNKLKERLIVNNTRLHSLNNIVTSLKDSIISWEETLKQFERDYKKERFIIFLVNTGFDIIQRYVGMEELLMIMLDNPKWAKEMFDTQAKFTLEVFKFLVENGLKFDGVFLGNDMGYKNAALFSPACYKELIFPSDRLMCNFFHDIDVKVILHSDGNINEFIPHIIDAGFDCIQPVEVKAGMDLVSLKKKYGDKIAFMGGIDTRIIKSNNFEDMEEEIDRKFKIAKKGGGYIYHSDHSIPDNIGFSQYTKFLEIVKKHRN